MPKRISKELHKERMEVRKIKQWHRKSDFDWSTVATKNNDPEYRKN